MGIPADPSKRSAKSKAPTKKVSTPKADAPKAVTPKVSAPRKPRKPAPAAEPPGKTNGVATHVSISADDRHQRIAVTAYFLAEARGFEPGHDHEDWYTAERLIGSALGE
jgi:hypothetical protein